VRRLVEKQGSPRSLLSYTAVADRSPCFAGGLALAQVLFFYVKYLVLFGVPALLMRLDGLTPPPLPRCVSTMFSFTGMWRSVSWFAYVFGVCLMGLAGFEEFGYCSSPSLKHVWNYVFPFLLI
jgi:hypothetical protein